MTRWLRLPAPCVLLGAVLACAACNKGDPTAPMAGPPPGMMPPGGMFMPGGGPPTPIRQVMDKLTKGPQSLTTVIGTELKSDPPPWDTIGPQAKEFAQLAATMVKYDPPKGSKESWTKLAGAYADAAAALDKAAQAKDKDAAMAAHNTLAGSCKDCHQQHRGGGPGGFGLPGKGPPGLPPPPQ